MPELAGERVLDVPPKLAARVRLLEAGDTSKNDPNDALSVAVAALRSRAPRPVLAEDHAVVLKIWSRRHRDLARARNQAACRLHAVLCDLVPGGIGRQITACLSSYSPLLTVGPLSWELMSTDADLGPDGGSARSVCHHPARWEETERPTHMVIHLHRAGQGHVCALLIGYGGPRLAEHALVLPTGDLVGSVTNRPAYDNRPAASA